MNEYYRLSGGGNDFLALVQPDEIPSPRTIVAWCRRGVSLGADGVFLLDRPAGHPRMRYFNADGHGAELCLNGTRCAVRLANELGWIGPEGTSPIETGAGLLQAEIQGQDQVRVELPVASEPPVHRSLQALGEGREGWEISVGVPHFVQIVAGGLADLDLSELGPALRYHSHFPSGANINWIEPQPGGFGIRTWERGVEAETLACGTGVLAAAASAVAAGLLDLPAVAHTRGGFPFRVLGTTAQGRIQTWSLVGDARLLAHGTIHPGASSGC